MTPRGRRARTGTVAAVDPTPSFATRVRDVVASVPRGSVVTYGEVAAEAGSPGAARAVGRALRGERDLPWWRVVPASGRLVTHLAAEQARRLRAEGVTVRDGRVQRLAGR